MKKELLILQSSQIAWADFCKNWVQWVGLAAGGIVLMLAVIVADIYVPEYKHVILILLSFVCICEELI
jgi:hypothetical protein